MIFGDENGTSCFLRIFHVPLKKMAVMFSFVLEHVHLETFFLLLQCSNAKHLLRDSSHRFPPAIISLPDKCGNIGMPLPLHPPNIVPLQFSFILGGYMLTCHWIQFWRSVNFCKYVHFIFNGSFIKQAERLEGYVRNIKDAGFYKHWMASPFLFLLQSSCHLFGV